MSNVNAKRKREERRKKAKLREKNELIQLVPIPGHINVIRYDSEEFSQRCLEYAHWDRNPWVVGRGEAQHLWNVAPAMRQNTFQDISPEDFIAKIFSLNSDIKMQKIEEKFAAKFGSYQAIPYQDWAHKVHDLWMDVPWNPHMPTLMRAVGEVIDELRSALIEDGQLTITPLGVDEAITKVTKGRNSGWPFFTSKWAKNQVVLDHYVKEARLALMGEDVLNGQPHILYKRVQPNGAIPKMRPVECPPKSEAIAAKCLTDRFIDLFKKIPAYYGFNGGERVYEVLDPFMRRRFLVESDFSSFDQRVVHLMQYVFYVISQVTPRQYWAYLQNTINYYQHAELITPVGILSSDRKNGLMSGEGWTSVIGTLANSIAVKYSMMRMGVRDYERLSFGDDIAIAADEFDVTLFEKYMLELGMDCNKSKQNVSEGNDAYFSFLGWYHFRDDWKNGNRGKFPMCRIAPGLYYREFYLKLEMLEEELDEGTMEKLRQSPEGIDIMALVSKLNNCRNNDDFEALVRYVREHSPKKLSTEYIVPVEELRLAMRNGRKIRSTSLSEWPVVQLLYKLEEEDRGLTEVDPEILALIEESRDFFRAE